MKVSIIFSALILLCSSASFGANPSPMNQGNRQNMMQVMQQVQQCMADIDQTKLAELKTTSERMKTEIDSLCSQGKRDDALKKAIDFGKKIAADPTVQQMRKCGEMAQGAMPMPDMVPSYDEKKYANQHVCDE